MLYQLSEIDKFTDQEDFSEDVEKSYESQDADVAGTFEIYVMENDLHNEFDDESVASLRRTLLDEKQISEKPN